MLHFSSMIINCVSNKPFMIAIQCSGYFTPERVCVLILMMLSIHPTVYQEILIQTSMVKHG